MIVLEFAATVGAVLLLAWLIWRADREITGACEEIREGGESWL